MASTRITVTLSEEQVAELREITDNVSGYVAAAVDRQIRHELLAQDLQRYEAEHGTFTDEERATARAKLLGTPESGSGAA